MKIVKINYQNMSRLICTHNLLCMFICMDVQECMLGLLYLEIIEEMKVNIKCEDQNRKLKQRK